MRSFIVAVAAAALVVGTASAEDVLTGPVETRIGPLELQGGYPSAKSVGKLYDEIDFQRATQAYIWATPLVAMEALRSANARDWGVDYNDVGLVDGYTTPVVSALTGNNTTIYAGVFTDLERDGPVVIDSPVGVYGVIDDFWQRPVVEVGPFGPDKGKGGKFLLLPPGYDGPVPDGYLAARSKTNKTMFIGRAFVKDGDIKSAVDTLARIKVYPLSRASHPPETRVVRAGDQSLNSIAPKGFGYWQFLSDALDKEPVEERDRFFHAMLKPLGIEKGKAFKPDDRQKKILTEAADVGFLMAQTLSMAPRLENARSYPGTHWEWVLTLDPSQEAPGYTQLDERTDYTFEAITIAEGMIKKIPGAGSQYERGKRPERRLVGWRLDLHSARSAGRSREGVLGSHGLRRADPLDDQDGDNEGRRVQPRQAEEQRGRFGRRSFRAEAAERRRQLGQDAARPRLVRVLPMVWSDGEILRQELGAARHREERMSDNRAECGSRLRCSM
ncbi:DUF1254 domain-containing protein [Rhizobium laguerreae]